MTLPKPQEDAGMGHFLSELNRRKKIPPTVQQSLQDMPNYSKLRSSEKFIYNKLAGVPKGWMDAAEKLGNSWVGKTLTIVDSLAEGLERGAGTIHQYATRDKTQDFDFKDAWSAGSLLYDVTNLPNVFFGGEVFNLKNPSYDHLLINSDLPGASYLASVRKNISEGMTIDEAKADLYTNLGALALRSQLNDTYGHILLDPLNVLLGAVKPVTKIKSIATLARTGKVTLESAQESLVAAKAFEVATRAAGNIDEAEKAVKAIKNLESIVENYATLPQRITTVDKIAMFLSGDPLQAKGLTSGKYNPLRIFALTNESRGLETVFTVKDNIGSYIIANHLDDPAQAVVALNRAKNGALGTEYGLGMLSPTGQHVQGYMGGVAAQANDMLKAFDVVKDERTILKTVSEVLGESETAILKRMNDDPAALIKQLTDHPNMTGINPALAQKILTEGEEGLTKVAGNLKDMPYTNRLFMLELKNKIEETVMRQAILKYGVGEAKLITRYNNMLKAAESLAYMRLSPAYLMRNFVNNEFTMAARGLFGTMDISKIDEFWDGVGWIPSRLSQGFGAAGTEVGGKASKLGTILEEALIPKRGAPEKIRDAIRNINLGKWDMVKKGGEIQAMHSKLAMTAGFLDWKKFQQYSRMQDVLPPATFNAIKNASPELPGRIEGAIRSGLFNKKGLDDLFETNLNVDFNNVIDDASKTIGFDIRKQIPQEILAPLEKNLPDALKNGTTDQLFAGFRNDVQNHLDELIDENIANLSGEVATRVQMGGRPEASRLLGKAIDGWHQGEVEYTIRMSNLNEAIAAAKRTDSYDAVRSLWRKLEDDSAKYWGRQWKRLDGTIEGVGKGLDDAGVPFPKTISQNFKEIKTVWTDFYSTRKNLRTEFFDALANKKKPAKDWDEIQKILDEKYVKMIESEAKLTEGMDVAASKLIQDPKMRQEFMTSREIMANLKKVDKAKVIEMRNAAKEMNPGQRARAWTNFWKQRNARYQKMWETDRATQTMLGGGDSRQMFKGNGENTLEQVMKKLNQTVDENGKIIAGMEEESQRLNTLAEKLAGQRVPEGTTLGQMDVNSLIEMGWNGGKKRLFNAVNEDRVAEGLEAYKVVEDVPVTALEKHLDIKPSVAQPSMVMPEQPPRALAEDQFMLSRGFDAVDNIELSVKKLAQEKPTILKDMPQDVQDAAMKYINQMRGEMNDNRFAAIKFAEFRRDSALLNYNRRTNFDTMVGTVFPFAFWTTGSLQMWALHSIDRPAMLSSYLKIKKFMETAGQEREGMPSRLLS